MKFDRDNTSLETVEKIIRDAVKSINHEIFVATIATENPGLITFLAKDSFTDMNEVLQQYFYSDATVEVFAVTSKTYTRVMHKWSDMSGYSTLAAVKSHSIEEDLRFISRQFLDAKEIINCSSADF